MNNSQNRFCILLIFFLFLFLIYLPSVYSNEYYADINISIDESGFVTIQGTTNHPDLIVENTELYTSKKQSLWEFNITKKEVFSDFIYSLKLPRGSSLYSITSSSRFQIQADEDNLIIIGYGHNESFSLIVQYKINKISDDTSSLDINVLFIFVFLIIVVFIYLVYTIFQEKRRKIAKSDKKTEKDSDYDFRGLSSRQKKITKLLINSNRPLTQADIQKELDIPKAAVSRNIHALEIKGIIEIEKIGMSNLIRLKKK